MNLKEINLHNFVIYVKILGQLMKQQYQNLIYVQYVVRNTFFLSFLWFIDVNFIYLGVTVHTGCRDFAKRCYPCEISTIHQKLTSQYLHDINCSGRN